MIQKTARTRVRINTYSGERNIVKPENISQVVPDRTMDFTAPVDKKIFIFVIYGAFDFARDHSKNIM